MDNWRGLKKQLLVDGKVADPDLTPNFSPVQVNMMRLCAELEDKWDHPFTMTSNE